MKRSFNGIGPRVHQLPRLMGLGIVCASLGLATSVSAQEPMMEEPVAEEGGGGPLATPTGPLAIQLGIGAAIGLTDPSYAQFKIAATGAYHFDGATGPAVGLAMHLSFVDFTMLQILARFQWDIELVAGFLIAPLVHLGAALTFPPIGDTQAAFDIGFGAEAKIAFGMFYIWLRPIYLDILIQDQVGVRWDVLAGAGITF